MATAALGLAVRCCQGQDRKFFHVNPASRAQPQGVNSLKVVVTVLRRLTFLIKSSVILPICIGHIAGRGMIPSSSEWLPKEAWMVALQLQQLVVKITMRSLSWHRLITILPCTRIVCSFTWHVGDDLPPRRGLEHAAVTNSTSTRNLGSGRNSDRYQTPGSVSFDCARGPDKRWADPISLGSWYVIKILTSFMYPEVRQLPSGI